MGYHINPHYRTAAAMAVAMVAVNVFNHATGQVEVMHLSKESYDALWEKAMAEERDREDKFKEMIYQLAVMPEAWDYYEEPIVSEVSQPQGINKPKLQERPTRMRKFRRFLFYGSGLRGTAAYRVKLRLLL